MDEYAQMIFDKILNDHPFNYAEIALKLARQNPRLFCELAGLVVDSTSRYEKLIHNNIMAGQVIQAIKDLRAETGWGLKESKDYVDEYRRKVGKYPYGGHRSW